MAPRWNTLLNHAASPEGSVLYNEDGTLKQRAQYNSGLTNRSVNDLTAMGYNPGDIISNQTRIAPLARQQQEAQGYIQGMARQSSSPVGSMRNANGSLGTNPATGQPWGGASNDARLMIEDTLGGYYLGEPQYNAQGQQTHGGNPYMGLGPASGASPFLGGNP